MKKERCFKNLESRSCFWGRYNDEDDNKDDKDNDNEDDKDEDEKDDRVEYSEDGDDEGGAFDNDDNLILGDVYPLRPPQSPLWLPTELLPEK